MYSFYRLLFGSKDLEKKMDDVESLVENEILPDPVNDAELTVKDDELNVDYKEKQFNDMKEPENLNRKLSIEIPETEDFVSEPNAPRDSARYRSSSNNNFSNTSGRPILNEEDKYVELHDAKRKSEEKQYNTSEIPSSPQNIQPSPEKDNEPEVVQPEAEPKQEPEFVQEVIHCEPDIAQPEPEPEVVHPEPEPEPEVVQPEPDSSGNTVEPEPDTDSLPGLVSDSDSDSDSEPVPVPVPVPEPVPEPEKKELQIQNPETMNPMVTEKKDGEVTMEDDSELPKIIPLDNE